MLRRKESDFEYSGWIFKRVHDPRVLEDFSCGDEDLDEYFQREVLEHKKQLLTETYMLCEATGEEPVALISMCNDSVKSTRTREWISLPPPKDAYPFLPAVKIARFGVVKSYQGNNIGTHIINMVKVLFRTNNRTGCRLLTVDAYNRERITNFYIRNEFDFLTDSDKRKKTRTMFFDLKRIELDAIQLT